MGPIRIRSLLLAAIVISNCITWTASRHHYTHNVSRHRSRHRRQGDGLYLPSSYVVPGGEGSGAWGEWGTVSPCSRTCGGGVASQKRICLEVGSDGQPACTGGDTKYFSCQTQDCPEGSVDFRHEQCSKYNHEVYNGFRYQWVPYTPELNQCELKCMPKGQRFYYRLANKVIDGTRCNDESFDVCVDGICQPVGCDMMLGSNAREDNCRECRGNNTNCNTYNGQIPPETELRQGYNDILLIPAGATNINIEEVKDSNNYLALRSKTDNKYYLNGNFIIDFPRTLTIAGAPWHYERRQQGFASPDKLRCQGPTNEPLFLSLLLQEDNVGIKYEYSLPTSVAPPPNQQYIWVHDDYTPCSATCGGGLQTRSVTCRTRQELETVDDSLCEGGVKPATNQSCNTQPCAAHWVEGPWSVCSQPCGEGGTKSRTVHCEKIITNGYSSIVADSECIQMLGEKPPLFQECSKSNTACPKWFTGPWKPCDKLCGEGKKTRQVVCYQKDEKGRIEKLSDENCADEKPPTDEPCELHPCDGVDWITSGWNGCDSCTSTVRTRSVVCGTKDMVVNDTFCAHHQKPLMEEPCNETALPACDVQWYATQWSNCSVNCGVGVRTREVFCGFFDGSAVQKVEDSKCNEEDKYNDTKPCEIPSEKCPAKWFTSPWGLCNVECDGGLENRRLMCILGNKIVDESSCDFNTSPDLSRSCNTLPCNKDEVMPVNNTSTTIKDEDESEFCEEEDYSEVGAEADEESETTPDDMMFSDSPVTTIEGSGSTTGFTELESEFEDEGSGSEPTSLSTIESSGSEPTETTEEGATESSTKEETSETESSESSGSPESSDTGSTESSPTEPLGTDSLGTESTESSDTESLEPSTESSDTTDVSASETSEGESTSESSTISESSESTTHSDTDSTSESSESHTELSTAETSESSNTTATESGSTSDAEATETETTESDSDGTESTVTLETEVTSKTETEETTEPSATNTEETTGTETDGTTESNITETEETTDPSATETEETTQTSLTETTPTAESDITETEETTETSATETEETTETGLTETTPTAESDITETGETTETSATETGETTEPSATKTEGTTGTAETEESTQYDITETGETTEPSATETEETTGTGLTETKETTESSATDTEGTTGTGLTETEETTESSATKPEGTAETEETTESSTTETEGKTETGLTETESTAESDITETEETTEPNATKTEGTTETGQTAETESEASTKSGTEETTESEGTETTVSGLTTESEGTEITSEGSLATETTEETEETTEWTWSSTIDISRKGRKCKPRKSKCKTTKFGCCPDNKSVAYGPFEEGCLIPKTCKETVHGCCPDGVSPATGPKNEGCPTIPCKETLFGCCKSDNKTPAEGNDQEGCPEPPPPCKSSKYGCCKDGQTQATGPKKKGCPETESKKPEKGCAESKFGCCADNKTEATGANEEGCPCNITQFGCCPDGVSPALGAQMEGCVMSCNNSAYGCCPDGETPAHGEQNEGCCLQSPFGCCPDNYKPAEGPHMEGCGCQFAPYGCCPDNVTIARGPNNDGCGCQYTQFGCCPDRHTEASGPDYEGCDCHTYQFGCCPDGSTIAKGPSLQGCHCQQSKYGCCGDKQTAATGPNQAGCDCSTSEYGCCPDGETEAKGKKFLGCTDLPENRQAACSLPTARGSCRNYTAYWYYDITYGGCSRFWYGGCEGNGNRFSSKEECEDVCVQPSPKDACKLPKVKGACEGYHLRWYYDSDREQCSQFVYGGCLGNANKFESRDLCQDQCEPSRSEDTCKQSIDRGPCAGNFGRWGYNSETRRCEQFIWGGCEGNGNRFSSEAACIMRCDAPGVLKPECLEPQELGNCTEKFATWSFSQTENRCMPFYYTGCGGNGNRFESEQSCTESCPSAYVQELCALPAVTGECANYELKWYYDTASKRCRQFYYGGCGGNGNNFASEGDCENRCKEDTRTTTTPAPQPEPEPFRLEFCFLPAEHGPCRGSEERWAYDAARGACVAFQFGGCAGNRNNFPSEEYCNYYCVSTQDICQLPMRAGPCDESLTRFFYDPATDSCSQFTYSGCDGNGNNFESQQDCESRCRPVQPTPAGPAPTPAPGAQTIPGECSISPDLEDCASANHGLVWYYDPATAGCSQHFNDDDGPYCRRTGTFQSEEACLRSCGAFRSIDVCRYQMDAGPCRDTISKFFFNQAINQCEPFSYGGCHGGPNRFSTIAECEQICKPERDPCKQPVQHGNCVGYDLKWHFDQERDSCEQFVYTGCDGNDNRFDTKADCESQCRRQPPVITTTTTVPPRSEQPVEAECQTPNSLAPCGDNITVFYYDEAARKCSAAGFGGCRHPNSYRTEEECERRCGLFKGMDPCNTPLDPGPCRASYEKVYWDMATARCESFAYGGCAGGPNRFSTIEECEDVCGRPDPACLQTLDPGDSDCEDLSQRRWFFSQQYEDCQVFIYSGCGGNENNFVSFEECESLCRPNVLLPEPDEPDKEPDCSAYVEECRNIACTTNVQRARTADGCERCSCAETDCEQQRQQCEALTCYFGVDSIVGADGCQRCSCKDHPCASKECPAGEHCEVNGYRDPDTQEPVYTAECKPIDNVRVPDCSAYVEECRNIACTTSVQRTRTADGCERCSCAEPDCEQQRQQCATLTCNYGVDSIVGDDGCQRCSCKDHPCASKECLAGERCEVNGYRDPDTQEPVYTAECKPIDNVRVPDCSAYVEECRNIACTTSVQRTRTADGCERCSCAEPDCEQQRQQCATLTCNYGVDSIVGDDGCQRCSCKDHPCAVQECPSGERCVVNGYRDPDTQEPVYTAECRPDSNDNEVLPDCSTYVEECRNIACTTSVQRTRTEDGCERCSCAPAESNCEPSQQECDNLKCDFGMDTTIGEDGCPRCRCKDHPCASKECPSGDRCVLNRFRDPLSQQPAYVAECRTTNKPGVCPAQQSEPSSGCGRECYDDADCRGVGKCCAVGCSQLCLESGTPTRPATRPTTYAPELLQAPQANLETVPAVQSPEGGRATLRCLFHGNPPPTITWRRGEITIDGSVGRYRLLSDGALEIVSLYRNDSGVYICVADNGLGVAHQEIHLQVNDPVNTTAGISGDSNYVVTGELGRSLNIRCLAYGYPEPAIFWYRGIRGPMVPFSSSLYEARGNVLQIRRLTPETVGEYACQAYNGIDKAATWTITVQAYSSDGHESGPYIVARNREVVVTPRQPQTQPATMPPEIDVPVYQVPVRTRIVLARPSLLPGEELSIPCEVDGYPIPDVHWTKDGARLSADSRMQVTDARLTIQSVAEADSGEYSCHARNQYSDHSSSVDVSVRGVNVPEKCTDNPFFADCKLIVRSKYCTHHYYSKFCCKSCVEAGQLDPASLDLQAMDLRQKK